MILLISLAFLWILWLVNPKRRHRFFTQTLAIVLISCYLLVSPLMVRTAIWGLTHSLPLDTGEAIDAIVVLGRGEDQRPQRVEAVKALWESRQATLIFASGMLDARPMVEFLKEWGIPARSLGGEECSQSTQENALFTAALLKPQKVRTILLVTDEPHMGRAFLVFKQEGFTVHTHSVVLPSTWKPYRQMILIIREYLALANYIVSENFPINFSRTSLESVDEASERIISWNCKV